MEKVKKTINIKYSAGGRWGGQTPALTRSAPTPLLGHTSASMASGSGDQGSQTLLSQTNPVQSCPALGCESSHALKSSIHCMLSLHVSLLHFKCYSHSEDLLLPGLQAALHCVSRNAISKWLAWLSPVLTGPPLL